MVTENRLTDGKNVSKPKQLWDSALRAVKGDSIQQVVEEFTAEMTLVAEGLCEDHSRLKEQLDRLAEDQDHIEQRLESEQQSLEITLAQGQQDTEEKLRAISRRLDAMEKQQAHKKQRSEKLDLISRLTILAAIVCGSWVMVTLINALLK